MNPITQARQALLDRLRTITITNGYQTDAGNSVRTGWLNEVLREAGVTFPLIVLQPAKPSAQAEGRGGDVAIPLAFNIVGAAKAGIEYEAAIDNLTLDLARCLVPQDGVNVSWRSADLLWRATMSAPEFFPPGDGLSAATVLFAVETRVIVRGA